MENEKLEKFWLEMYQNDKIGTIAKLSQAMQHMAWLREWKRIHGDEPRVKPITKKIDGEKVKIGEADIAVSWSDLDEFFRAGNEYGDIETVKFLSQRIENGDITPLTKEEIHDLGEKENVKWSDGKHSLNPLQGYLYDFTAKDSFILELAEQGDEYGKFYPIFEYTQADADLWVDLPDWMPNDSEKDIRYNQAHAAFQRYYTTRLVQQLLSNKEDSKYYDFVSFDITSVTTPGQILELDKKLIEIVQSPEIKMELKNLEGNVEFEREFYDKLRNEVEVEIKKDTDRIENAYNIFTALETGDFEKILQDPETEKWAKEVYSKENIKEVEEDSKNVNEEVKVSAKDIASASKDLATKEVKGAGGILSKLFDKIKNMFK